MTATEHELNFWKDFVKTERFLKGWAADIPTPELHDAVKYFFRFTAKPFSKVLDVGSGVVSILNGLRDDWHLIACDLLGSEYKKIFDYNKYGIQPPYPVSGEHLDYVGDFDFVHISNALDHVHDPQLVFNNMVRALKDGGYIIIQGFEDEAEHENYQGMHQHNLRARGDRLFPLDTSAVKHRFSFRFPNHFQGKTWFIYIAQKS